MNRFITLSQFCSEDCAEKPIPQKEKKKKFENKKLPRGELKNMTPVVKNTPNFVKNTTKHDASCSTSTNISDSDIILRADASTNTPPVDMALPTSTNVIEPCNENNITLPVIDTVPIPSKITELSTDKISPSEPEIINPNPKNINDDTISLISNDSDNISIASTTISSHTTKSYATALTGARSNERVFPHFNVSCIESDQVHCTALNCNKFYKNTHANVKTHKRHYLESHRIDMHFQDFRYKCFCNEVFGNKLLLEHLEKHKSGEIKPKVTKSLSCDIDENSKSSTRTL